MARLLGQEKGAHCTVCQHPHRVEIERLISRGASLARTATKFAIGRYSVRRHMLGHVSPEAKAEYSVGAENVEQLGELVAEQSGSVLDHYALVRSRLYARFDAACAADDRSNVARLASVLHENFRDVSRITGELSRSPLLLKQTNIINHPDNSRLISAIVAAVAPYEEARIAVAQALRQLEAPALEDHRGE